MAVVGPVTHASGMLLMPMICMGVGTIILNRFDVEEYLETVQREKVTHIFSADRLHGSNHPKANTYDLSSLKTVMYGAAPMSVARIEQAFEFFGPILVSRVWTLVKRHRSLHF